MKKLSVLSLATVLVSTSSYASYNSDKPDGGVTCTASNYSVSINARRSVITLTNAQGTLTPEKFNVVGKDSNGDTWITYIGRSHGVRSKVGKAELSFNDEGDTLELNGNIIPIQCPK